MLHVLHHSSPRRRDDINNLTVHIIVTITHTHTHTAPLNCIYVVIRMVVTSFELHACDYATSTGPQCYSPIVETPNPCMPVFVSTVQDGYDVLWFNSRTVFSRVCCCLANTGRSLLLMKMTATAFRIRFDACCGILSFSPVDPCLWYA